MMTLDFPSQPALNQEYRVGHTTYVWDGQSWKLRPVSTQQASPAAFTKTEVRIDR